VTVCHLLSLLHGQWHRIGCTPLERVHISHVVCKVGVILLYQNYIWLTWWHEDLANLIRMGKHFLSSILALSTLVECDFFKSVSQFLRGRRSKDF
jgi:hypothetical protein